MITAKLKPPNSLIFVMDPSSGQLPESLGSSSVTSTLTSLAIGTLSEVDGETQLILGSLDDGGHRTAPDLALRWSGEIETSGSVAIVSAENLVILEVSSEATAVIQIWSNDEFEPDLVCVLVGGP